MTYTFPCFYIFNSSSSYCSLSIFIYSQSMFSWFRSSPVAVHSKQRMLGSAENALMSASQKYQGYLKVGEVLHMRGPYISIETLTAAVIRLQRRHPMLRSRLQHDPANPSNFFLEDDDTLRLEILLLPRKREDHLTFWGCEWREREKETTSVGQGLAKLWLLQVLSDTFDFLHVFVSYRIQMMTTTRMLPVSWFSYANTASLTVYRLAP
jgi:hypothetical protein